MFSSSKLYEHHFNCKLFAHAKIIEYYANTGKFNIFLLIKLLLIVIAMPMPLRITISPALSAYISFIAIDSFITKPQYNQMQLL